MGADAGERFVVLDGLGEVVDRAGGEGFHFVHRLGERGHEEDGHIARFGAGFQAAAGFEAVETGHHHIEEDEVGLGLRGLREGFLAVFSDHELVAGGAERLDEHAEIGGRVVDDENGFGHGGQDGGR